jgi:esterase/lipase
MLAPQAAMKRMLLALLVVLALVLVALFAWPIPAVDLYDADKDNWIDEVSYEHLVSSIHTETAASAGISRECHSILLEHGRRTGRVYLFFHGITNCPMQFAALGRRLYETGANVYIPRLPHHGLSDRMTTDLANLQAQELADFAQHECDLAVGLGDTVIVSGLSLGAVLASYLGQYREDVSLAVPIAPLLGPAMAPAWAARPLTRAALVVPNRFVWWNDKQRENLPGPKRVYPRFATRAMAETMRLGAIVEDLAAQRPPRAKRIVVVTVGGDPAVNNQANAALVRSWQARAPGRVTAYEFPESLHLGHNVIDPDQPYQRIGVVYPILEKILVEAKTP